MLKVGEQEKPQVAPGEVLVKLVTSGVNPSDVKKRMGSAPNLLDAGPVIPHSDGAGVIEAVGRDVQRWQPGDRVTVPFAVGCGHCDECLAGNQHICDNYFGGRRAYTWYI